MPRARDSAVVDPPKCLSASEVLTRPILGQAKVLSRGRPKPPCFSYPECDNAGMPNNKTLGERVKQARLEKNWSQVELAAAAGLSNAAISELERDITEKPKMDTLLRVCRALGKDITYFTGQNDVNTEVISSTQFRKAPLISWVQAGQKQAIVDAYQPGVADEWEEYTVPASRNVFALRVRGASMTPDFPEGTVIIVDPELQAQNGDYVVVRFENSDEATFKQLIVDGPMKLLKPLNSAFPVIQVTEDARLCGVVIEASLKRKFR